MTNARFPRQVPPPQRADGLERRTTSYSRFIPREELSDVAAWSPEALSGAAQRARAPISAPAPPAPAAPPMADKPAEPPAPDVQQLLHAARQTGYQDGYRDGLAALDAFKASFAQQLSAQLGLLVTSFDAEFLALEAQMAEALTRTAVELARQVVRSEITQRPEQIATVAHDAVEALHMSARHVRVRVNPADFELVMSGAGDAMKARDAQVLPDPDVARGGCAVESDIGSVDASLAARWQQAGAAMGQTSLWEDRRGAGGHA